MPYRSATGKSYDSGDFAGHLERAQELADWSGFPQRLAQSKKAGRLRGIGLSTYIEACGSNGPETATVKLERDGSATVLIGSQTTGQGHATAYAQLIAEHLGLPPPAASGPAVRARSPAAALRSTPRQKNLPIISKRWLAKPSKRVETISRLPAVRCALPAPTARSPSTHLRSVRTRESNSPPLMRSRRLRRLIPTAPISRRSRSIRRREKRKSGCDGEQTR